MLIDADRFRRDLAEFRAGDGAYQFLRILERMHRIEPVAQHKRGNADARPRGAIGMRRIVDDPVKLFGALFGARALELERKRIGHIGPLRQPVPGT